jgi:purine-binding chemotaxis protein CheW
MSTLQVRVRVADEDYALPVEHVIEVAEYGVVAPVPGAGATVIGVSNLKGDVVPVVDLGHTLGLPRAAAPERIVVVEEAGRRAGLAVDSVEEVEQLSQPAEEAESPHLLGTVLTQGALIGLVDVGSVLDSAQGTP